MSSKLDSNDFLAADASMRFEALCSSYSDIEQKALTVAFDFAKAQFSSVLRLSGGSLFDHNLRSACFLLAIRASSDVVAATLLHGALKHVKASEGLTSNGVTERDVFETFGKDILDLLKGADSVSVVKTRNKKLEADALRKVLLTTLRDPRILFIKFAVKLDNLQHIDVFEAKEQQRIAQEVLDVYAPLAYRLGAEKLRRQLEDEAFRILHPSKFTEIVSYLKASEKQRETIVSSLISQVKKECPASILKIKGRTKHLYSIYKKMVERGVSLDEQYDHLAIRITVASEKDCYVVLGYLHEHFEPISGRLKDYIANPKPNGYQSIHTGILLESKRVEVQVRTEQMDEFAEEGMAAHWMYKGVKGEAQFQQRMGWLKGILDLQTDADSKEFLENVKVDLFTDEIYVYTPKGDVRYLAKGSGVLDFAYSVHEQVGNTAIGARINGKFVPLRTTISQGDVIEIVTSKNQRPRQSWLKFVKSSKAKQKIRKGIKEHEDVPLLHYRQYVKTVSEEHDTLAWAPDYEKAACVLAKCCLPIPGNEIVGVMTKRRLISVHTENCKQSLKMKERWIPTQWKQTFNKPLQLHVQAGERSGLLADLLNTIARARFIVKEAKAKFVGTGTTECSFVVVPRELEELERLLEIIFKVKGVKKIYFG